MNSYPCRDLSLTDRGFFRQKFKNSPFSAPVSLSTMRPFHKFNANKVPPIFTQSTLSLYIHLVS